MSSRGSEAVLWVGVGFAVLYLMAVGRDLLIPLVVAIILWYLLNALAHVIGRWMPGGHRLSPALRMFLAAVVVVVALVGTFAVLTQSLAGVTEAAPRYQENLDRLLDRLLAPWLGGRFCEFLETPGKA